MVFFVDKIQLNTCEGALFQYENIINSMPLLAGKKTEKKHKEILICLKEIIQSAMIWAFTVH